MLVLKQRGSWWEAGTAGTQLAVRVPSRAARRRTASRAAALLGAVVGVVLASCKPVEDRSASPGTRSAASGPIGGSLAVGGASTGPGGKPLVCVAATILPIAELVDRVGGSHIRVEAVVGPGQSHETYEPTPRQVAALAEARLYFRIGLSLEEPLLAKLAPGGGLQVIDLRQVLTLIDMTEAEHLGDGSEGSAAHAGHDHAHHHGAKDPHVWLDPRRCARMANAIHDHLSWIDPDHAEAYARNRDGLLREIEALDQELAAQLAPLKGRSFLVFHPALGYFADAYGLRQLAIEIGGKEPSARQLAELATRAKGARIRTIFVQPQFASRAAEALAREIGARVVPLDPTARDWMTTLRTLAARLCEDAER